MSTVAEAVKVILEWVRKKQDSAILYHLLKNEGRVEPVVNELDAPAAEISIYRDRLEDAGYLQEAHTSVQSAWIRTIRGEELLRHLESDRNR